MYSSSIFQSYRLIHSKLSWWAVITATVYALSTHSINAQTLDFSALVEIETRLFPNAARFPEQSNGEEASLRLQPEWVWENTIGNQQSSVILFHREDSRDPKRSHSDIREAYWLWVGEQTEILIGINKEFWGVTESQHLVDIINQTDLIEDLDGEAKFGQPMLRLSTPQEWGTLSLWVLPYFRERSFPGIEGRLRTPLVVDTNAAQYTSSDERQHIDYALRYSHFVGDWDIGFAAFHGTSREPQLASDNNPLRLIPIYDQIRQLSLDAQFTYDAWLLKIEALTRSGYGEDFNALVTGVEYTFFQLMESDLDLGVLFEYAYDGRSHNAPPTLLDDDYFIGLRVAFNDVESTAVLAGLFIDPSTQERSFSLEAERRLGDDFFVELRARVFDGASESDPSFAISRDDYLQLSVAYYF